MSLEITELNAGDILLYSSDNLVGRLIRKFDGAEVSHAGLYLGNGQVGEALIAGNPGVHQNPIAESVAGCNWVEAARLESPADFDQVLAKADVYLNQGNRYAYEQILMLAMILLTRKLDQSNWLVRKIAERTLSGCASLLHRWRDEQREPMICSEFVFRAFDEALPDERDQYTIEINAQGIAQSRPMISRRRRWRLFGAVPNPESPTVHPDSLLAQVADEPVRIAAAPAMAGPPKTAEEIEADIEAAAREYLGDDVPMQASAGQSEAMPETSEGEVKSAAAAFAQAFLEANETIAESATPERLPLMKAGTMSSAEQLMQVVSDFVTPGDLHRSTSLTVAGRLDLERIRL